MDFVEGLDWGTYYFFQYHRKIHEGSPWLQHAMSNVTALGGGHVLALIGVFTVLLLLAWRRYRAAIMVAFTFATAGLLTSTLQAGIQRERPPDARDVLGRPLQSGSFPSGHALQSTAAYTTVALLAAGLIPGRRQRLVVAALATILVLLIGFSRLYLGCHFLTDVIGGWVIGLSWALSCWTVYRWFEPGASAAGNSPVPDGPSS